MTKGYVEFFFSNAKFRDCGSICHLAAGRMVQHHCTVLFDIGILGLRISSRVLFSVRMALFALSQPINGLLADRMSRKKLMLWANIFQVFLALSFLFVDGEEDMWWLIAMSGLMMLLHGVYVTAERAALPNIVDEDDLITANAIDSASWSTALCVGAMLGGIVVSIWGTDLAFIIDSYTFLLSSLLLIPLTFEQKRRRVSKRSNY